MLERGVVTGFNGVRDLYNLPLAFYENRSLVKHVSDFYLPATCSRFLDESNLKIKSRHRQGLPYSKINISIDAMCRNFLLKTNFSNAIKSDPYFEIDRSISICARKIASELKSDLFLHSGYAYWAFQDFPGRKSIFQFHPHPEYSIDELSRDFEKYPEVKWSYENETDSQSISNHARERLIEWKFADKIFCASSFTKRSLINAGANSDDISVIPYGVDSVSKNSIELRKNRRCQLLFVGQGVQRKGLHHLILAWRQLQDKLQADLTIICRKLDPGIEKMLSGARINLIPGLSDHDLGLAFSKSDVFVMPSIVEGFGLVYLEALGHGLVCIGTQNTGLPDIDSIDYSRRIVNVGDVEDLKANIVKVVDDFYMNLLDKDEIRNSIRSLSWRKHRDMLFEEYCLAFNGFA